MTRRAALVLAIALLLAGCAYFLFAAFGFLPGLTEFIRTPGERVAVAGALGASALVLEAMRRFGQLAAKLEDASTREQQLGQVWRVDALTRLASRSAFIEELDRAVDHHRRGGPSFALLVIDIDRFHNINEIHGHAIGDTLLMEIARRLANFQSEGAVAARLGGDEFALLVESDHPDELPRRVARRLIESLSAPVWVQHDALRMSATIGIATSDLPDPGGQDLLRAANIALTEAKRQARGTFRFFEADMGEALRLRTTLEADLRRAIGAGEIVPFYQPLIALEDGRLTGFEVLARWEHPRYGLVLPATFIPLAEEIGRVGELFYRLLEAACTDARAWPPDVGLSVNVSPMQFAEPQLATRILSILHSAGVEPSRLELEITENALVGEVTSARITLGALRNVGVAVALDDFGTGYSSLRHLSDLPIDRLKIDRIFVEGAQQNMENWKVVRAIVQLAHALDLETTAEGIEMADVADILRDVGCDVGQGYLFGKPLPAAATAAWLHDAQIGRSSFPRLDS